MAFVKLTLVGNSPQPIEVEMPGATAWHRAAQRCAEAIGMNPEGILSDGHRYEWMLVKMPERLVIHPDDPIGVIGDTEVELVALKREAD